MQSVKGQQRSVFSKVGVYGFACGFVYIIIVSILALIGMLLFTTKTNEIGYMPLSTKEYSYYSGFAVGLILIFVGISFLFINGKTFKEIKLIKLVFLVLNSIVMYIGGFLVGTIFPFLFLVSIFTFLGDLVLRSEDLKVMFSLGGGALLIYFLPIYTLGFIVSIIVQAFLGIIYKIINKKVKG